MTDISSTLDAIDAAGCTCHECGRHYRVDVNVPDDLWRTIGMTERAGLLCGPCILARVEEIADACDQFAAYELRRVP